MAVSLPKVLITGGAGYIGAETALYLKDKGYKCVVLDNLVHGYQEFIEQVVKVPLVVGDIGDKNLVKTILREFNINLVVHLSAYAYVGESTREPNKYYRNNVIQTLNLLDAMLECRVNKFVFSSTCATYSIPTIIPIPENHHQKPINPYGYSKLMVERILQDYDNAYGLKSIILRYFNAAGAHPQALLGEDHNPETHLIPLVLLTALGKSPHISVYGKDYPTPDGTCVRDYIHVEDLASAHHLSVEQLFETNVSNIFNLGNGQGYSVKQVIDTAKNITGRHIPVQYAARRNGDPPILVGGSSKAKSILGWAPAYSDLKTIIRHAWSWHQIRHGGGK